MSNKNDVVTIELDRVRELKFGHKSLKLMLSYMGKNLEEFEINGSNLEEIEKIMYFALLSDARKHGEELRLEDMEDLLDHASSFGEILSKLTLAINKAFDSANNDSKNLQRVAEKKKKTS